MLCLRANSWQSRVEGPASALSANSLHALSRVQKAKGMCQASCRHSTLTPAAPAASTSSRTRAWIACVQAGVRAWAALQARLLPGLWKAEISS